MASSRSIRRKKELAARKDAQKKAKQVGDQISRMPTACDECGAPFDKKDKTAINEWRIAVYDDGPVHLVCPKCVPDDVKAKSGD